jgi:hypothetical protein
MQKIQQVWKGIREHVGSNFKFATINFILIVLFISGIQAVFGGENAVVAIIITTLMFMIMTRRPLKYLCIQGAILCFMAVAASLATVVPLPVAFFIHFFVAFVILYLHTYECKEHLYFQYILGYLFFLFLSPVTPEHLPKRLVCIVVSLICMILYQWIKGKGNMVKIAREVLGGFLEEAQGCVSCLLAGEKAASDIQQLRGSLGKLSKCIDQFRKKSLCISDASFMLLEAGRSLEKLVLMLNETKIPSSPEQQQVLQQISGMVSAFRGFILQEQAEIPSLERLEGAYGEPFGPLLSHIRKCLLEMPQPEKRRTFRKTALPVWARVKAVVNISRVRLAYAFRVSCVLTVCILIVQQFHLSHGKWLLFTIVSVSLPYADDVGQKAKKRMLATVIGGLLSVLAFSLIPSPTGRMGIAMLSGYLSFYMTDYLPVFSCATIGALSGAMLMDISGWQAVGGVVLIRLGYIVLGILIALVCNCLILPFKRQDATHELGQRYIAATEAALKIQKREQVDLQLYYNVVIYIHLLEDKLRQNAAALKWEGVNDFLEHYGKRRKEHGDL